MYIEKIEIPAFRVLRDVVLEFGEGYDPQIFPIGSENGGGKSTLLQLIFVLLHCSADPERHTYLENLLASNVRNLSSSEHLVARLRIRIGDESRDIEFVSYGEQFLHEKLETAPLSGFYTGDALEEARTELRDVETRHGRIEAAIARLKKSAPPGRMDTEVVEVLRREFPGSKFPLDIRRVEASLLKRGEEVAEEIQTLRRGTESLSADVDRIAGLFISMDCAHITNYTYPVPSGWDTRAFICRSEGISYLVVHELLERLASSVFLLGPSNQQYLFLGTDTRKALLGTASSDSELRPQIEYLNSLDASEGSMTGFFAYDWLSVDPLLRLFASARDEDFKNVVKTGRYGSTYTTLMSEVNGLLLGKKVRPLDDLSGVEFVVVDGEGRETALSPEDLSQGELKRLMIYAWLRANHAVDAVVLIDEIEASFHPDWQVGIVRDLQDWAPKNQYLLATHSYELCQALTPRHVRELKPPLRKGGAGDAAE